MSDIKGTKFIPSSYDRKQVWFLPIVFLGLTMISFYVDTALAISLSVIFLLAILRSILLIPYRIVKESNSIVLKRILGDVRITEIDRIEKVDFSNLRRKFGIGGLLGFYGYYLFTGLGGRKVNGQKFN